MLEVFIKFIHSKLKFDKKTLKNQILLNIINTKKINTLR